ncbi:MAG: hypothetical protein OHK0022_36850 [Roseiflexaceae bacterium]
MDEQQINALTTEIVREQLPDETDLIGETAFQQIVEGHTEFEGGSSGLRADMLAILGGVASAVTIVKGSLEIVKVWRELHGTQPTVEQVQSELAQRTQALREAADGFVKALIAAVLTRINRIQ